MKTLLKVLALYFLSSLLFSLAQARTNCGGFEKILFSPAKTDLTQKDGKVLHDYPIERAQIGNYRLETADILASIHSATAKSTCSAEVKFIDKVHWLKPSSRALYTSIDGSTTWATFVDMENCKTLWQSRPNSGVRVESKLVKINADCGSCDQTHKYDRACVCQAAEVWKFSPRCDLVIDKYRSLILTKDQLNIAFSGKRKLKNARSLTAKIVN